MLQFFFFSFTKIRKILKFCQIPTFLVLMVSKQNSKCMSSNELHFQYSFFQTRIQWKEEKEILQPAPDLEIRMRILTLLVGYFKVLFSIKIFYSISYKYFPYSDGSVKNDDNEKPQSSESNENSDVSSKSRSDSDYYKNGKKKGFLGKLIGKVTDKLKTIPRKFAAGAALLTGKVVSGAASIPEKVVDGVKSIPGKAKSILPGGKKKNGDITLNDYTQVIETINEHVYKLTGFFSTGKSFACS